MFFNGLFLALSELVDEETYGRCRALSGVRKFIDFFSYPVEIFLRASFLAAEVLERQSVAQDEVFRRLGRRSTQDILSTAVGKTLTVIVGNNPKRLIGMLPSAY
ncbi:MAG TPA: DUF2378 family protein, partial [Myxococcaceae bacterium]|nr:DUF2378 family protein [Myxococcaceae bacterium]